MILNRLFAGRGRADPAADIYAEIVAQSRQPVFYTEYCVPDTVEGRFEMIVLHTFVFLHRMKREAEATRRFGQSVFDAMFMDMDRSLREMGVGDLTVPKKVRKMAEAFYGRVAAYEAALAADEPGALAGSLKRNVLAGEAPDAAAARLAAYARRAMGELEKQEASRFLAGHVDFPDPEHVTADTGAT